MFVTQVAATAASALVGGLLKIDPRKWPPVLREWVEWVQGSAWWIILVLVGVVIAARGLSFMIGPTWVWKTIEKLFNDFREEAFNIGENDAVHDHRVTLFKRTRWKFRIRPWRYRFWPWGRWRCPWSGWLVPVVRSGHTTQRSRAVFLAPDDADNVEGVAGQTWARDRVLVLENLPELTQNATADQIREYAQKTWVSEDWVRNRLQQGKSCPRSLCGIPVEIDGVRWGVIVLDSCNPHGIRHRGHAWEPYRKLLPALLRELLKRRV